MSETISNSGRGAIRRRLLLTVSALALLVPVYAANEARANSDDVDHPVVWIELGGQFALLNDNQEKIAPPFFAKITGNGFASPLKFEKAPATGTEENASISFSPEDSDWVFRASVRYGRNAKSVNHHEQTNQTLVVGTKLQRYAQTTSHDTETHDIFDFMAGKDIGLGALGMKGTSVFSGGLRFVQFRSKSDFAVYSDPDYVNPNTDPNSGGSIVGPKYWHNYSARMKNKTSFTGIGPSVSWDASASVAGDAQKGQITLDWGLNGTVLFGRQKSIGFHETKGKLTTGYASNLPPPFGYTTTHYTHSKPHTRSRRLTVPNVGALAGFSFRYANAKVSFGYSIDEFFGAVDGGIDARKRYNFGESGPFVNISFGLGG